jgi:acyl-CoA thioesterase-1
MECMHLKYLLLISMVCFSFSCNEDKKAEQQAAAKPAEVTAPAAKKKTIVFFGDSLSAGYGLDEPTLAFPGLIQRKLDSLKMDYQVVNAGVSGETSSGGVGRIEWILNQPVDVFILELGANDGLRGIPVETTAKNLQTIMDSVKSKNPSVKIILAGMQVPPNMGAKYANAFKAIFPTLAENNKVALIPFLLEGVGGEPALNQADGIHPNEEGHRKVAEVVWKSLNGIL